MIRLDERTYCLGIWFLAGVQADWLGVVTSDVSGPLTLRYRYRHHADPMQMQWWKVAFPRKTEGEILLIVDDITAEIRCDAPDARRYPGWRRIIRGYRDQMVVTLQHCSFLQIEDLTGSIDNEDPVDMPIYLRYHLSPIDAIFAGTTRAGLDYYEEGRFRDGLAEVAGLSVAAVDPGPALVTAERTLIAAADAIQEPNRSRRGG